MYKFQVETEKIQLGHEKEVFNQLKDSYAQALADTKRMIKQLQSNIETLEKADLENKSVIQSKIYRLNYQKALEEQLEASMSLLNSKNVSNIQSFLTKMYEDGFISINYHLQKHGIPIIMPINPSLMIKTINTPVEKMKFSERLYKNTGELKKKVKAEISRGIASGKSYSEIAKRVSRVTEADFNQAYRIARTEGGRVSSEAKLSSMQQAREKGADLVKQWDATLDGKTRPAHVELDQQIREIDEPFEINYEGQKAEAMHPHGFGIAALDINCRCVMLSVPRWDIEEENERYDPEHFKNTGELIVAKNYNDWKEKYYKTLSISKENNTKTIRQFIETIKMNELAKKLRVYEESICSNNFESSFVIQSNGDVIKFTGDDKSVNIYDVDLSGAVVTHNHPIDYDVYRSFGEDDFTFIKNTDVKILRITTPEFEFEIEKLKDIDISYNDIYIEACSKVMMDETLEIQHEAMEILKERGYVRYERRTRKSS